MSMLIWFMCIFGTVCLVDPCVSVSSGGTRRGDVRLVKTLIRHERWTSVSVVYQDHTCVSLLKAALSEIGVLTSFFDARNSSTADISDFVSFNPPIPVVLLSSNKTFVKQIIWQECFKKKRTPLGPQQYWLFVWPESTTITELSPMFLACVTHVAVVIPSEPRDGLLSMDQPRTKMTFVYTLLQTRASGRRLRLAATINECGNMTTFRNIFPNKHGFNQEHFTAATLQVKPFLYKEGSQYVGFLADILNFISSPLNFTYSFVEAPDGKYGSVDNGSWNGLIGMLVRQETDIIMADISTTYLRQKVVDFTHPYNFDVATVVMRRPIDDSSSYLSYIQLYRWEVHVCIWSSIVLAYLFVKVIERVNPFYRHGRVVDKGNHSTLFWLLYGSLLKQGGRDVTKVSQSRRVFLGTWWIFAIIMSSIYSGNLIAFLTVSRLKLPFDTISGMVQQDRFTWGTYGGSNYIKFFETSKDKDYQKVAEGFKKFPKEDPSTLSTKAEEHRLKVLKGDYCFIGGKPTLEFWVSQNCQLKLLNEGFYSLLYGIVLPKNSPYTKDFSDQIIGLHETGIMAMMKTKWWPQNSCNDDELKYAKAIQLSDIQSAFYVLVIGTVMTFIVLLFELLYFKLKTRCQSFQTQS
ncbi:glutamate receptor ionotropic, kainate 2-like [Gigantopelta aegis]|uniref:glutamate receptor ionotropic, kainate 2-like n=1 Tax=Gigantopelta aegis TaxID=1735272 RepID=UPI001B88A62E|nr:glutamate receptor ionotropic, kainate 2-like [Gigantopelta aegis]